jgi:hypothetical protein
MEGETVVELEVTGRRGDETSTPLTNTYRVEAGSVAELQSITPWFHPTSDCSGRRARLSSCVYLLGFNHDQAFVKVGKAGNTLARVSALQSGTPYRLNILAQRACHCSVCAHGCESAILRVLKHLGLHANNEWFVLPGDSRDRLIRFVLDGSFPVRHGRWGSADLLVLEALS